MNNKASAYTPIPTARMDSYLRNRAVLDWLDAALSASECGDYEGSRVAAAEARKALEIIFDAEAQQ